MIQILLALVVVLGAMAGLGLGLLLGRGAPRSSCAAARGLPRADCAACPARRAGRCPGDAP